MIHAELDPHALERGDYARGGQPFVSVLVERLQAVRKLSLGVLRLYVYADAEITATDVVHGVE